MKFDSKSINKYITIFLLIQPIIDLFTSLGIRFFSAQISMGMITRFMFLILSLIYIIFISNSQTKKVVLLFIGLILGYSATYILIRYNLYGIDVIFSELKMLIKIFYFPILLLIFMDVINNQSLVINSHTLVKITFMYVFIICLAQLTRTQFTSYTYDKLGHVGWFYAANEIGAILAITSPLIIYEVIKNRKRILYYFVFLLYMFSLFSIGTKVPFLGLLIAIFSYGVIYIVKMFFENRQHGKILFIPITVMVAFAMLMVPYTPIGHNLNINFKFLIDNQNIEKMYTPNHKTKVIDAVYSSRDIFLKNTKKQYNAAPVIEKLFGIGYYNKQGNVNKLIEMDFHDIYYRNGIIGFIVYFSVIITIINDMARKVRLQNIRKIIMNEQLMSYFIGIYLALLIAFIAGHVLFAPAVSIYIVMLFSLVAMEIKKYDFN